MGIDKLSKYFIFCAITILCFSCSREAISYDTAIVGEWVRADQKVRYEFTSSRTVKEYFGKRVTKGSYRIHNDLRGNRNLLSLNFGINEFGVHEGIYVYKIVSLKNDKMILKMLGKDDVFNKVR